MSPPALTSLSLAEFRKVGGDKKYNDSIKINVKHVGQSLCLGGCTISVQ
jgi:hypothetical protein